MRKFFAPCYASWRCFVTLFGFQFRSLLHIAMFFPTIGILIHISENWITLLCCPEKLKQNS